MNRQLVKIATVAFGLAACGGGGDDPVASGAAGNGGASGVAGVGGATAGGGSAGGGSTSAGGAAGAAGSGGSSKQPHDCGGVAPGATFFPIPAAGVGLCMPANATMLPPVYGWSVFAIPNDKNLRAVFAFAVVPPATGSPEAALGVKGDFLYSASGKIGWDQLPVTVYDTQASGCTFLDGGAYCEDAAYVFQTVPFRFAYAYQPGAGDVPYAVSKSIEKL